MTNDLDPLDAVDQDDDPAGVIIPPETMRVLMRQPRDLPGRVVVWSGRDPFDANTTTNAAQYVARILAARLRADGYA
jgi:hypothetical protein